MSGEEVARRLLAHSSRAASGCLEWTGAVGRNGYGRVAYPNRNKMALAHRVAYIVWVGAIPKGYQVDHLCRNTRCIEPAHLEAVTPAENNARSTSPTAINAAKVECIYGHEFTTENTRVDKRGHRDCWTCRRRRASEYARRRHARRRAALEAT